MITNKRRTDRTSHAQFVAGSLAELACARIFRAFLLLALLIQCSLFQTHVHFAQLAASAGISSAQATTGQSPELKGPAPAGSTDHCPLCWEAAMAGHYYLPAPAVLPVVESLPIWIAGFAVVEFRLARPSHGWLSRAPPQ